jgi:hypothetical protein
MGDIYRERYRYQPSHYEFSPEEAQVYAELASDIVDS